LDDRTGRASSAAYLAWFAAALLVALALRRRRDALLVALLALPCAAQIAVAQWRTAPTAGNGAAMKGRRSNWEA
jgi:MYXO-CTERM domain-containing protein